VSVLPLVKLDLLPGCTSTLCARYAKRVFQHDYANVTFPYTNVQPRPRLHALTVVIVMMFAMMADMRSIVAVLEDSSNCLNRTGE